MSSIFKVVLLIIIGTLIVSCGNSSEVSTALIPVEKDGDFQYINADGELVINPQFKDATFFRGNLALVQSSGDKPNIAFIDRKGKYAFNQFYIEATTFEEGLAWVVPEGKAPIAINQKGKTEIILEKAEKVRTFHEGLAAFSIYEDEEEVEKWGFINKKGEIAIHPQFTETADFSEGLCRVFDKEGLQGYIDEAGEIVVNYKYHNAKDFKDNKAIVYEDGKAGVINKKGNYIINPLYDNLVCDGDKYLYNKGNKWGWLDKDGKIEINHQFRYAYPFNGQDLAPVAKNDEWGFIDKEGKIVINPQFDLALPFFKKFGFVVHDKKLGIINQEGKYIVNPQFDGISEDLFSIFNMENLREQIRYRPKSYNNVSSDYFDTEKITSKIDFINLFGLNLSSNYDSIASQFKIAKRNFRYNKIVQLVNNQTLSKEARLSFYVNGKPYRNYKYSGTSIPDKYIYKIDLYGKGIGKTTLLIDAFESKLVGFKKDGEKSNSDEVWYYNNEMRIGFSHDDYRQVSLVIERS